MADATLLVDQAPGFVGIVSCSTLADVIQLNVNGRFRGCLAVQHGARTGRVFFHDGQIVHAEQGDTVGEAAFYEIMTWPGGRFRLDAGVRVARRSIEKNWQHLVLEALRLHDERRAAGLPSGEGGGESPEQALLAAVERLHRTPGVTCAVAQRGYGEALGYPNPEEVSLASDARYASFLGKQLGAIFGTGEGVSTTVRRSSSRLLCLGAADDLSLAILLSGEASSGTGDAVRKAIGGLLERKDQPAAADGSGRRRQRLGSMECDWQGRVRANTFNLSQPAMAREVALLVGSGVGDLDGPVEQVQAMEFRYREARLVVERSARGFSLALWAAIPEEIDPIAWACAGESAAPRASDPGPTPCADDQPPVLLRVCNAAGAGAHR